MKECNHELELLDKFYNWDIRRSIYTFYCKKCLEITDKETELEEIKDEK